MDMDGEAGLEGKQTHETIPLSSFLFLSNPKYNIPNPIISIIIFVQVQDSSS